MYRCLYETLTAKSFIDQSCICTINKQVVQGKSLFWCIFKQRGGRKTMQILVWQAFKASSILARTLLL